MKKYFVSFTFFMLLVIPTQAFANLGLSYNNGLFDKVNYTFEGERVVIDNDLSSYSNRTGQLFSVEFESPQTISYMYARGQLSNRNMVFYAYDSEGVLVKTATVPISGGEVIEEVGSQSPFKNVYKDLTKYNLVDISKLVLAHDGSIYSRVLYEIEFFGTGKTENVKSYSYEADYNKIHLNFEKANETDVVNIFVDDVQSGTSTSGKYTIGGLKANTTYEIGIVSVAENGDISDLEKFEVTTDSLPTLNDDFVNVTDIGETTATLNFDFQQLVESPEKITLYQNGRVLKEFSSNKFVLEDLQASTKYEFAVDVVYPGDNRTNKVDFSFTTLEISPEISNLTAKAKYNRVDLSWELPGRSDFEYVTIYRKENRKVLFSLFSTGNEYDPLFETNGTYFNDLTVEPETSYTYLLTSYLSSGEETKGVTIDVETPPVEISGGDTNFDEELGDYVITWTEPTEGKILVTVGGKEYAVVNASELKITIPKEDMKFDKLGFPDVTLTPLDENEIPIGKPSKPGDVGSVIGDDVEVDLNPKNVLESGIGLLLLVGGFVLLGLSFLVVPKLINIIVFAFKGGKRA